MELGLLIAVLSLIFAIAAFILSVIKRREYRKELSYRMLFDLNSLFLQHFEEVFISGKETKFTRIQSAHATLNFNFIEGIYRMSLQNDVFLKPVISSLIELYGNWFEQYKESYALDFQSFVENHFKPNKV